MMPRTLFFEPLLPDRLHRCGDATLSRVCDTWKLETGPAARSRGETERSADRHRLRLLGPACLALLVRSDATRRGHRRPSSSPVAHAVVAAAVSCAPHAHRHPG